MSSFHDKINNSTIQYLEEINIYNSSNISGNKENPMVTVIWVNYNSRGFIDIVEESLKAILSFNYPNYETIIIDNGSTDGSFEILKNTIHEYKSNISARRVLIVRLDKNYGFAGAVNIGYKLRSSLSKYVVLINNDAIPIKNLLNVYVDFMERHKNIGAAQGIILRMNSNNIDSAGFMLSELFNFIRTENILHLSGYINNDNIDVFIKICCIEGTMPIFRIEALKKALYPLINTIFIPAVRFYYLEDIFVSLKLWNSKYIIALIPKIVGGHMRKAIIKKIETNPDFIYETRRNFIALIFMTNYKFKYTIIKNTLIFIILNIALSIIYKKVNSYTHKILLRSLLDGIILGFYLKRTLKAIDIRKVPYVRSMKLLKYIVRLTGPLSTMAPLNELIKEIQRNINIKNNI